MRGYVLRRLALMIPTLFGIMLVSFVVIQFAPGGPVEHVLAQLESGGEAGVNRVAGGGAGETFSAAPELGASSGSSASSLYRGARGLDPEFVKSLEIQFGFDRPAPERFVRMMLDYLRFDFGESYYRKVSVLDLILEKMPVSISLGLWSALLGYGIAIPLGVAKASRRGGRFDAWTSGLLILGYAAPSFLLAVLLVVLFAGGSFLDWFPLRGLASENWESLSWGERIVDYFHHLALPLIALSAGGSATATFLIKNSFLDELGKQYVLAARAKGASERRVLYGHVFRNAMLIVIAGFPGAFVSAFFAGSLLIETVFSLDGLGLLGFEAAVSRDYPVVFATLYIFSLLGMGIALLSDLTYAWVDPRLDFEAREG